MGAMGEDGAVSVYFTGTEYHLRVCCGTVLCYEWFYADYCDLSVQVLIPQTVYEYASSFVPVDTTRASRHRKAVLDTLRQLLPHSHTLVDQLNNGQHITSTVTYTI